MFVIMRKCDNENVFGGNVLLPNSFLTSDRPSQLSRDIRKMPVESMIRRWRNRRGLKKIIVFETFTDLEGDRM